MKVGDRLRLMVGLEPKRSDPTISLDEWASYFTFNGTSYPYGFAPQTLGGKSEEIADSFSGICQGAYKQNGVIFACMLARLMLFSEARFQFRKIQEGRPGELFGTDALSTLQTPWPGATTGDLLTRMIQDADLSGNFFARSSGNRVIRMRPDWVTIMLGSFDDPDVQAGDLNADLLGYIYHPGGKTSGRDPVVLQRGEVAHFAPIPDPTASYKGMSWITPILREIMGDNAATNHKLKFFENGATPNMVVSLDPSIQKEKFEQWIKLFEKSHEGVLNAYKTLYLGGGADAKVVGADMKQIDFKITQGAGETRVAAAAGVPPVIVGLSEGLEASTYSNYAQARRRFADGTMRPLWRNMAGSLATIIDVPADSELWYDDRDISFLQEDQKDAADIQESHARTIKALTEAGYEPKSVIDAVTAGDLKRLKHTGQFSVQLHPPGTDQPSPPSKNGKPTETPVPV